VKNPKEKNYRRGREFTRISADYKEFYSVMLQLQSVGLM